jgi:hypothetical protein
MADALDRLLVALAERILDEGLIDRSAESLRLEEELQEAGAEAVPFWLVLLESEVADCRYTAVFNLRQVQELADDAVGALARHALEDAEPRVRKESAAAVLQARVAGAAALLDALAADPNEDVAAYAVQARAGLGESDSAAAPPLAELIDYEIEERIARALMAGVPADPAPPGFIAADASAGPRNLAMRREASAFAARVAGEPDAPELLDLGALALYVRDDPDEEVRHQAALALERLVPPPPAPGVALVRALRDRGFLRAADVALLRLAAPLAAAPARGPADPLIRAILQRLTGAERLPPPSAAPLN